MRFRPGLAALCLAFTWAAGARAQDVPRWKWEQGDRFYVSWETKGKRSTTVQGKAEKKDETALVILDVTVGRKDVGGGVALVTRLARVRKDGKQPDPKDDPAGHLKGDLVTVYFGGDLKANKVQGLEDIYARLPKDLKPEERWLYEAALRSLYLQPLQDALLRVPDKASKPNESWTQASELEVPSMGKQSLKKTITDLGREAADGKDLWKLGVKATVSFVPTKPDPRQPINVLKVRFSKYSHTGTAHFDPERGRLDWLEYSVREEHVITMQIRNQVVEVAGTNQSTTTVRILDKLPPE
jgi:hypothetical protein